MNEPTNSDGVPAEVLRRRKLFDRLREEVRAIKPDAAGLNEEFTAAEMIEALTKMEGILERAEVVRYAKEYCADLANQAAMPLPDDGLRR